MNNTKTINGIISLHDGGNGGTLVYVSGLEPCIASFFDGHFWRKKVSVRMWFSDKQATKDELVTEVLMQFDGLVDSAFGAKYSELTGYLWTDEMAVVGGHDIIKILKHNRGKWVYMEIDQ